MKAVLHTSVLEFCHICVKERETVLLSCNESCGQARSCFAQTYGTDRCCFQNVVMPGSLYLHYTLLWLFAEEYGAEDKAVRDATQELEDLRRTVAERRNIPGFKKQEKLTLCQLEEFLSKGLAKTGKVGDKRGTRAFEEEVLGWR